MKHTGGAIPSQEVIEDVVSSVIVDLLTRNGFSPERGRFRAYLAMLANARTVDTLRKDRPLDSRPLSETEESQLEAELVGDEFNRALLATMLTELREKIPHRWFAIFEQVKLKGRSPEDVAQELQVSRSVVDNTVFKAMQALRHIAKNQEYRDEYYEKP